MRRAFRTLLRRKLALCSLFILGALLLTAALADVLATDRPLLLYRQGALSVLPDESLESLRDSLQPALGEWMLKPMVPFGPHQISNDTFLRAPGAGHWLGTDELGRDVLARLIHGARSSLIVGVFAVLLYVLLGIAVGASAGFFGGRVDLLLSRAMETMMTFPTFFFVLCVLGLMRVKTLAPILMVIALTRWPEIARLVRAEVLRVRALDFVQAARCLGASEFWVLLRHVIPHALSPVWPAATFGVAGVILIESGLSFLGLGAPPPAASWGDLLTQAKQYVIYLPGGGPWGAWWLALFPGLALFATVAAFNLVGEALRDALDPRHRG